MAKHVGSSLNGRTVLAGQKKGEVSERWDIRFMRTLAVLIAIALPVAGASAVSRSADEKRQTPEYDRCMASGDAAKGITIGLMDCNGAELDRQDTRLNRTYGELMRTLGPPRRAALRAGERAWIKTRDATCDRQAASNKGGSLYSVVYSSCLIDETIKRTIVLEAWR